MVGIWFAIYFDCLGYKVYSVHRPGKPNKYTSLLEITGGQKDTYLEQFLSLIQYHWLFLETVIGAKQSPDTQTTTHRPY